MDYSETIIKDGYDFPSLDCQFFDGCAGYDPKECMFGETCKKFVYINNEHCTYRDMQRLCLEDYVGRDTLKYMIDLSRGERG